MADPRSRADRYFALWHRLNRDGKVHVFVPVILVGDVHIVTRPHIISDADREMSDDSTSLADQTPVSNFHDTVCEADLSWDHSRRQRAMWSDHGVSSDVNVPLIEDRVRGEADDAVLSKTSERATQPTSRADGTCLHSDRPPSMNQTGEATIPPSPPTRHRRRFHCRSIVHGATLPTGTSVSRVPAHNARNHIIPQHTRRVS